MTGDNPHYIKTVKLISIPRVGESISDEESRHFRVKDVMHLEARKYCIHETKSKPHIDLYVTEY